MEVLAGGDVAEGIAGETLVVMVVVDGMVVGVGMVDEIRVALYLLAAVLLAEHLVSIEFGWTLEALQILPVQSHRLHYLY